jgi:P pilus assembly chaperone PapD
VTTRSREFRMSRFQAAAAFATIMTLAATFAGAQTVAQSASVAPAAQQTNKPQTPPVTATAAPPVSAPDSEPNAPPAASSATGVGDLLVAPTRLILEGRTRTAELALVNIGDHPATFRISLTHMKMLESGDIKEIPNPGPDEILTDSLIRYSPRQVILDPHVVQTVRIQLRLPETLADGEYRTHLLFRGVPSTDAVAPIDPKEKTEGFRILLTPIYGVSIPIIIRHGDTTVAVTMSVPRLELSKSESELSVLHVTLNRTGTRSVYGNITVRFTPKGGGKEQVVGMANGVAVYTPLPARIANVVLRPPAGVNLSAGTYRVTYMDAEQVGGGLLAEALLSAP